MIAEDVELPARRREAPGATGADSDLVFFLVDLDKFKSVNDTYGHAAGDAILVSVAGLLREAFRSSDHLVRWGGEEFLVVARFVHRENAEAMAEKLRSAVERHAFPLPNGETLARTCSVGFASFPFVPTRPRGASWTDVVALADAALYAAKASGRNRWIGVEAAVDAAPGRADLAVSGGSHGGCPAGRGACPRERPPGRRPLALNRWAGLRRDWCRYQADTTKSGPT